MRIYSELRLLAVLSLACSSLFACSAANTSGAFSPSAVPARAAAASSSPGPLAYVAETCPFKAGTCSPRDGFVQILGGSAITSEIYIPTMIATDASGNVYVGNESSSTNGYVTVYRPGALTPYRTIKNVTGTPHGVAVDASGNAYVVSNYKYECCQILGAITEYAPDGSILRRLNGAASFASHPMFDAAGNLYVTNFDTFPGYIAVYKPGATDPSRIIIKGIGFPKSPAFDPQGNLYVLNQLLNHTSNVVVYAPGKGVAFRTITDGLVTPVWLAIDPSGSLYIANEGTKKDPGNVIVFAPGSTSVTRTIRTGIANPFQIAFDAQGRLYVVNAPYAGGQFVSIYAPGASSPFKKYRIAHNISAFDAASSPGS
jgi:DNA-binding beta-propeller fold protein YncE